MRGVVTLGVRSHRGATCVVAAVCVACGGSSGAWEEREAAISGGERAAEAQFENVVWLDGGCTGTLVHERVILTAGHCSQGNEAAWFGPELRVEVDGDRIVTAPRGDAVRVPIERCEAHPPVEGNRVDLAICVLARPMAHVPVVLPAVRCERTLTEAGDTLTLVGYGLEAAVGASAGVKRIARAPLRAGADFAVGGTSSGSCWGDSGGPAFARTSARSWRQLGVLSQGEAGVCGFGIYVELWPYLPWLEAASNVDLTPCHAADGTLVASPACVERLDAGGLEQSPAREATCNDSAAADGGCGIANPAVPRTSDGRSVLALLALAVACGCKRVRRGFDAGPP